MPDLFALRALLAPVAALLLTLLAACALTQLEAQSDLPQALSEKIPGVRGGHLLASTCHRVLPPSGRRLGPRLWDTNVSLIRELPSKIVPADVLLITIVSFVLSVVATVYPSWRASRVQPAEALRYE